MFHEEGRTQRELTKRGHQSAGALFRLIEQQLTAEDEELTPTMKLRRKLVNEKYKNLIDGMYVEAA